MTEVTFALQVHGVSKAFDQPVLSGLDFDVPTGALVALLGPSGCGKTTLMRLVAGFDRADSGTITVGGQRVDGPGSYLPPERRRVGVVPQEGALFPHLSVRDNVGFGLARSGRSRRSPGPRDDRVDLVLEMVGLAGLGDRMPHELSGGQQQRVAVARALAPEPALILLDEPFSALDAGLRSTIRAEVRACLREAGTSAVLVTHDQQEALSIADLVAVMRDGRVVQAAEPWEVYSRPVDLGVASFVGEAVLLEGEATGQSVSSPLGELQLEQARTGAVTVVVRPEQLEVSPTDLGAVDALVLEREFYGHDALLRLRLPGGALATARTPGHPLPAPGSSVPVGVRGPVLAFPR